ncbi:phytanoyl-CoA dioxygenase family protein [Prosthecobacter sp.]|uniref:phytanoyl-CoA dioxygenase family protein n=1 Tax=Prosthecobacter sp. TaxID=1965333 RepID=UPI0037838356
MSTNTLQECDKNGYDLVRGFLTPENLLNIHAELRLLADAVGARIGVSSAGIPDSEIDRPFVEIVKRRPDWQSILYQRLQQLPSIISACSLPQVREMSQSLLKTTAISVWPRVQVRLDLFEDSKNHIRWHHDYLYNRGTQDSFTFWIPLSNVDASMGLLQIAKGSHITADSFHFEKSSDVNKFDYTLSQDQVDRLDIVVPQSYQAGDLAVFHSKTIHSGALNQNPDRARLTLLFRLQNLHTLEDL